MTLTKRIAFLLMFLFLTGLSMGSDASGQDPKKEAELRTVHGVVLDKSENPVSESVVFLKNSRTNIVRSSYTDETGKYRFSGLDPNADYEVHAEKEGAKSTTHNITAFDSRKDITLNLKIDRKKE
jgi:hypothetical protein